MTPLQLLKAEDSYGNKKQQQKGGAKQMCDTGFAFDHKLSQQALYLKVRIGV